MPKLPVLKSSELVKFLKKKGFIERRQKGSHLILSTENKDRRVTVPMHNKPLRKGTLASILKEANISLKDVIL